MPLTPLLVVTALASIGTGILWTGLAFIAEAEFHFSKPRALTLYLVLGVVYFVSAFSASRALAGPLRRLRPRSVLALALIVQAAFCALPVLARNEASLWITAIVVNVTSALLWPIIESYLSSGRTARAMRSALGLWNVVWTASVALSMLMLAPMLAHRPSDAILILGVCNLLAIVCLAWFPASPAEHARPHGGHAPLETDVGPDYPRLLVAFRVLLLLSYVVAEALAPLLPFILAGVLRADASLRILGVDLSAKALVASVWMGARVIAVAFLWRFPFWHGSWRTLHIGAACLALGFAGIVASPALPLTLASLVALGVGLGIIYSAAIYYAMSVGHARVDAAGTHEAMIGMGYALGPAAGLLGYALAWSTRLISEPVAIIAVIWAILIAGGLLAWRLTRRDRTMIAL